MILISRKTKYLFLLTCLFGLLFSLWPLIVAGAGQGLVLSVTPTLFDMSATPGQTWSSEVRVINSNKHDLVVYAEVVNFTPKGEAGEGRFIPIFENYTDGKTLAEWVTITSESVVIPPESSKKIPFTVKVPADAAPGGHFAAIMVGTKPPEEKKKLQISTSQVVTSLFFVKVAGDVIEDGVIREFTTAKRFVSKPMADFSLRFENKGNVHIQPQGQIEITNMWGKERGVIPINQQTNFGNVLPESIRNFEFSWQGEPSLSDIGRYKAIVTLGYGSEGKKFQTSTLYFYVIPVKSAIIFVLSLLFVLWFVRWSIKAYVKRMLALSGLDVDVYEDAARHNEKPRSLVREGDVLIQKNKASVRAPMVSGLTDFRSRLRSGTEFLDKFKSILRFVSDYRLFFGAAMIGLLIVTTLVYFVMSVTKPARNYEVTINNPDQAVELSSEDIIYKSRQQDGSQKVVEEITINEATTTTVTTQLYKLELINAGDTPGAAAAMKEQLELLDYQVEKIGSEYGESQERTVIVYSLGYDQAALELSQNIANALLSARPETEEDITPTITVYIGNDYIFD